MTILHAALACAATFSLGLTIGICVAIGVQKQTNRGHARLAAVMNRTRDLLNEELSPARNPPVDEPL